MWWLLYMMILAGLVVASFLIYWTLLFNRIINVYEILFRYDIFREVIMKDGDISLHSDYSDFQDKFEKFDESIRPLKLIVDAIDRASGWEKIMLHRQLPKPKESREILKKLDDLTAMWIMMLGELAVEGKIEFDEGGEG